MIEKIEEIIELRDLVRYLELSNEVSIELAEKREELVSLSNIPKFRGRPDIFESIMIIDSEIYKNIETIGFTNKLLMNLISKLKFRKELFQEIKDCTDLSKEIKYQTLMELVKVFELYEYKHEIKRVLVSEKNKRVRFIDMLNAIIKINYGNVS